MNGRVEEGRLLLSGVLDLNNIDRLASLLRDHITGVGEASGPVRVDLAEVVDLDTAALQVFVSARRMADQSGKSLELLSANAMVRGRFRLTGLEFLCGP